jgi:hypothetical protein
MTISTRAEQVTVERRHVLPDQEPGADDDEDRPKMTTPRPSPSARSARRAAGALPGIDPGLAVDAPTAPGAAAAGAAVPRRLRRSGHLASAAPPRRKAPPGRRWP